MGNSHNKGPIGGPGGGLTRDFERQEKECSVDGTSLWELCEGNLEGGLLYWTL